MSKTKKQTNVTELEETQISEWLSTTPDFFERFPDVLTKLTLPDNAGTAISLHQYQVRLLQGEKAQLKQKLVALVKNVKTNHKIHSDLLDLSGEFIQLAKQAADNDAYLLAIKRFFALFDVKLVSAQGELKAFELLKKALGKKPHLCDNKAKSTLMEAVFAQDAPAVLSIALVPLKQDKKCHAYLVLAADDAERFKPDMGGEFLSLLARLLQDTLAFND